MWWCDRNPWLADLAMLKLSMGDSVTVVCGCVSCLGCRGLRPFVMVEVAASWRVFSGLQQCAQTAALFIVFRVKGSRSDQVV